MARHSGLNYTSPLDDYTKGYNSTPQNNKWGYTLDIIKMILKVMIS